MTDPVFFAPSRRYTAGEVANLTGATLVDSGLAHISIYALAPANEGGEGALVFVDGKRNFALMQSLKAAAVFCPAEFAAKAPAGIAVLVHPRPQQAFAMIGRLLFPTAATPGPMTSETGVSPQAHVDASAHIEAGAIIEAGAVIGPRASIGSGTVIAPHAVIGPSCQIGRDGYIGPGVSVQYALIGNRVIIHGGARIGQDGFGFVGGAKGPERVPQVGRVIIQDDVEIGANTTVDRGAMSDTVIGQGTKIDNLVQIAHNVRIGRNCIIAGLSGISGSVTRRRRCHHGRRRRACRSFDHRIRGQACGKKWVHEQRAGGRDLGRLSGAADGGSHARDRHAAQARQDAQAGRGGK